MWIKSWLSSAKIKVLVNGEPGKKNNLQEWFKARRPTDPFFYASSRRSEYPV